MKTFNPTKKDLTIIALIIITIVTVISFSYGMNLLEEKTNAKIELLTDQTREAEVKANTKSDIEVLEFYAKENAHFAKTRLEEISEYKLEIKKLEALYENEILSQRCFESQIDRKINGLEYNLDYCKDEANLDQYRTKKY